MDYLPYRLTNHGITILYHPPSVDLAKCELFRAKVCDSGKDGIINSQLSILRSKSLSQTPDISK